MSKQPFADLLQSRIVRAMADADQVAFHNDEQGRKASALLMAGKSLAFEEVIAWIVELNQNTECVSRAWLPEEIDQEPRSAIQAFRENAELHNEACDSESQARRERNTK